MMISINCQAQIKLLTDGKVGIGNTSPTRGLDILVADGVKFRFTTGQYTATTVFLDRSYNDTRFYPETNHQGYLGRTSNFWKYMYIDDIRYLYQCTQYSDKKFKKNITDLENSLDKITKLRGVEYDLDFAAFGIQESDTAERRKHQFGLIAQEVLGILPEIVYEDSLGYSISYTSLIPVLIEAIKDQQQQIEELKLQVKMNTGSDKSGPEPSAANTGSYLAQNHPNPFNENTIIEYTLATGVKDAAIYIYDMQGKQIKSYKLQDTEYGSVMINGSELQPGMYQYSLIADGEVVGIEKMILTE